VTAGDKSNSMIASAVVEKQEIKHNEWDNIDTNDNHRKTTRKRDDSA